MYQVLIAAVIFLLTTAAIADERLHGAWFVVEQGDEAVVENAYLITIFRADGKSVHIYPYYEDERNVRRWEFDVYSKSTYEAVDNLLTIYVPESPGADSALPYSFTGPDKLITPLEADEKPSVFHRLDIGGTGILPTIIRLAGTGQIIFMELETQKSADIRHPFLGYTSGAMLHFPNTAKDESLYLMEFPGGNLGGKILRNGQNWLFPVTDRLAAMPAGREAFSKELLDHVQELVRQVSPP